MILSLRMNSVRSNWSVRPLERIAHLERVFETAGLYVPSQTTRKTHWSCSMILLFTSDNCTWCDVLKGMLEEAWSELGTSHRVHEINVTHHSKIAEVYDVLVVPTLVAGHQKISGVPGTDDLKAFLIQAFTQGSFVDTRHATKSLFTEVRAIRHSEIQESPTPEVAN